MPDDFFTTQCWKKTALGTPIELFSSHTFDDLRGKRPIILMGGIHGDEPEGVRLAQDTLDWLKGWLKTQPRSSVSPWVAIPCLNVDGFARRTRVNGRGVDLNRNYPSQDWSSAFEKERYFPGPAAGSEPEIQGVVELMRDLRPRLMIHCHSWEPCIVGTGASAQKDSQRLAKSSGYEAREEIGYPTPGSLSRYGWHDHKIPVICIEEQEGLTDLSTIWPRFSAGMQEIFKDLSARESQ
jgi:protein MpaA